MRIRIPFGLLQTLQCGAHLPCSRDLLLKQIHPLPQLTLVSLNFIQYWQSIG
ncbi:MAG: hypothetical protein BWY82_02966 [Verrucomicrobia bacterium ADurb.Bin474]|nr:MAG: hypothetical protein BWY82_02966 [Verrucomicrobia bacterium ADurb.Bin474]